jgi:hypothetical protein
VEGRVGKRLNVLEDYVNVTYKGQSTNVKAKAWTLEAKIKVKDTHLCPLGSCKSRPVVEDYITDGE